ncbi:substrate-binding periplasmic protein [Marinobacter confluentis]|uniref:ABC transporter substrate-binding protein n=1 Tax=Marinobacter confluentis TaxID=1697557 RepID=A0A4Z1BYH0_9GAMM|nr:transporter substrate-binding domain-containing protein [Marinobacter confluentis]TGN39570.1 ABC transporter substrate-binding protein [Marinobacter confluentis]
MSKPLKHATLLYACLVITGALPVFASEPTSVRVGVYNFPPVAMVDQHNRAMGLLGDLLDEFRTLKPELSFEILHTSPKRRHLDFRNGLFDVIFFEHPEWGWTSEPVDIFGPILKDEEVYVTLNKPDRGQNFFDNVSERRIVAIAGYHYGFAGLETDSETLQKHFNVELSHSHQRNLDLILADRPSVAEVAVVSRSFLGAYFSRFPDQRDELLVSDTVDQSYELHVVTRKGGPIDAETIESLLQPLIASGRYQELVARHGLQLPASGLPAQN